MNELLKKLNYKEGMNLFVLNAPEEVESLFTTRSASLQKKIPAGQKADFIVIFVSACKDLKDNISILDNLVEDAILWFAYPKKSSKKYKTDLNRDEGWDLLALKGFIGVRQVAIDADWSALRYRHKRFVKKITRKFE